MHRSLAEVADTGLEARHKVVAAADIGPAVRHMVAAVVEDNQAARILAGADIDLAVHRNLAEAEDSLAYEL